MAMEGWTGEERKRLITNEARTHARGAERKKEKEKGGETHAVTPRGWSVLRYSCSRIIYDPRNERPHARCETQLVRLTRTLRTAKGWAGDVGGRKKKQEQSLAQNDRGRPRRVVVRFLN